jgi:hypothetical protein
MGVEGSWDSAPPPTGLDARVEYATCVRGKELWLHTE